MVARLEQGRGGAEADGRADRDSAAEPLGQGDDVGDDAGLGVREPGAGAADAGLHLVDPEQRAVPGRDLPGGGEEPGGRHDHAGLALQRLDDHRGRGVVDGRGEGVRVAVRHERDVARQRLERLAVGGLRGERQRRPWCGRGRSPPSPPAGCGRCGGSASAPPRWPRCRSWRGTPARRRRRGPAAARPARPAGALVKKFETCPRVRSWVVTASTRAGWAWPSALTAMPPKKSTYSRPSSSQTWAPSPRTSASRGGPKVFIRAPA